MYALLQAITFYECQNLVVKNLKIQNAQQMHVSFEKSTGVQVSNLTVTSPEGSPNTDGIHVAGTQNIQITDSVIGTGIYISTYLLPISSDSYNFYYDCHVQSLWLMKVMIVSPL
jgi:hypothetical protein